jgi:hypothetical protein
MILAVDPGQHNGYCLVSYNAGKDFIVEAFGTMEKLLFYRWLQNECPDLECLVVEDFKTRPNEARRGVFDWNQMVAPKVIGALEYFAEARQIPIHLQQPAIKPMGYGYLGKTYKKGGKDLHHWDAIAHAMFWLVSKKLVLPNRNSSVSKLS